MNLRKTIIGALGALALAFGMVGGAGASTIDSFTPTATAFISVNDAPFTDIMAVGDKLVFGEESIPDGTIGAMFGSDLTVATRFSFDVSGVPLGSALPVLVTFISGASTLLDLTFEFNSDLATTFKITGPTGNLLPDADGFLVSLLAGTNKVKITGTVSGGGGSSLYTATLLATPIPAAGLLFGSVLLIGGLYRRRKMVKEFGLPS